MLLGTAAGAAGVIAVQERYLPPRLSAQASITLRNDFEHAEAERARLAARLGDAEKRLATAQVDQKALADALAGSRATAAQLRDDLAAVVAALPLDPRGGEVEVRAARFAAKDGMLSYDLVLTRERAKGKPLAGVMQLVLSGASARGADAALALTPVALSIGSHQIVRGSLPLPDGFRPQQATVQVLDRVGGKALGKRVMLIR